MSADLTLRALFRSMVVRLGGQDAGAAVLQARYGVSSQGTLSKMCAGSAAITLDAVIALEDALGETPVTDHILRLRADGRRLPPTESIITLAGRATLAAGSAQVALAAAMDEHGPGGSRITAEEAGHLSAAAEALRLAADRMAGAADDLSRRDQAGWVNTGGRPS